MKEMIAMKLFVAALLLIASAISHASPGEAWECVDRIDSRQESILVTATGEAGRKEGNISVAGVTHAAVFEVAGFNRRWDFGPLPNSSFRYAFVIEPNGDATYFDFGNEGKARANPSNFMKCRQIGAANAPN